MSETANSITGCYLRERFCSEVGAGACPFVFHPADLISAGQRYVLLVHSGETLTQFLPTSRGRPRNLLRGLL